MPVPLLSAKLLELRQHFHYSQQEVADYLNITREAYSHYERATREPSLEVIVKLSKLYNVDISELINEKTILHSDILPIEKNSIPQSASTGMTISNIPHTLEHLSGGALSFSSSTAISTLISSNLLHLLQLFNGKNSKLNLTDVTKEDIKILAQYKKLSKQDQKEVRQFIEFKLSLSKSKKKE